MMQLRARTVDSLRQACLDDTLPDFRSDEVVVHYATLPGRAVVGAARTGGRLWIILDPNVPDSRHHLLALIDARQSTMANTGTLSILFGEPAPATEPLRDRARSGVIRE